RVDPAQSSIELACDHGLVGLDTSDGQMSGGRGGAADLDRFVYRPAPAPTPRDAKLEQDLQLALGAGMIEDVIHQPHARFAVNQAGELELRVGVELARDPG